MNLKNGPKHDFFVLYYRSLISTYKPEINLAKVHIKELEATLSKDEAAEAKKYAQEIANLQRATN